MKKCFLCEKSVGVLHKVKNKGYICEDCFKNSFRFVKCDSCKIFIDMKDDYIVYDTTTESDICEDCYKRINRIHSHEYEPKIKFLHKTNSNRYNQLHIGTELELITDYKLEFLFAYMNKYIDNEFYFKNDCSIGKKGVEIVSQPMTIDVIGRYWKPMFNVLKKYQFKHNRNCGLHFHIDREYLNNETIKNIDYIFNNHYNFFSNVFGRKYLNNEYCMVYYKREDNWGLNIHGKYCAVNLSKKNTVEIRIGAATNDYDIFIDRLKYIYATVEYCKSHSFKYIAQRCQIKQEIENCKRKLKI